MINVTRGATVLFHSIQFIDANRDPTVPDSALLYISYPNKCGDLERVEIPLVKEGETWSASWDSGVSEAGVAYWFVKSVAPEVSAAEGWFRVVANPANKG